MSEPRQLDVVATVASPDEVTSPFSGARAAFFHVEVLEIAADGTGWSLGEMLLGDVVVLRIAEPATEVALVVRRAAMRLVGVRTGGVPLDGLPRPPAEAIPLLAKARGRGAPCFREHAVRQGARLRLRAIVEDYSASPVALPGPRLLVRDDLGPLTLDEVLDGG